MLPSWISLPENTDFPLENLPYGIFTAPGRNTPRVGVAIGEHILDLSRVAEAGFLDDLGLENTVFSQPFLNEFMRSGKVVHKNLRQRLQHLLSAGNPENLSETVLIHQAEAVLQMPLKIENYTDFYSSEEHATNVGKMFRPDNPLMPNWKHLPVAYHGRASSIVLSGVPLHRPKGQVQLAENENPVFIPTQRLDFELEMAFTIGRETPLGQSIPAGQAEDYIFGMVLFNDWSARDVQRWEYQPLGPFLSKNFGSSISPWVVTLEALEPFRTASPPQNPPVLPYLQTPGNHTFDIQLQVLIQPENGSETLICQSNFKDLYWNICQQLAHHTVNGCNMKVGDLLASGTISGKTPGSYGSMLELTQGGKTPLLLPDGSERKFIQDYDTVILRAFCQKDNLRLGFGEVRTQIIE
jgi:fumarylacetoacetase